MAEKGVVNQLHEAFGSYDLEPKLTETTTDLADALSGAIKELGTSIPARPKVLLVGPNYRAIAEVSAVVVGLDRPCDIDLYEIQPDLFLSELIPYNELLTNLRTTGSPRKKLRSLFANTNVIPHLGAQDGDADRAPNGEYDLVVMFNAPPPKTRGLFQWFLSKGKPGSTLIITSADNDFDNVHSVLEAKPRLGRFIQKNINPPIGTRIPGAAISQQDLYIVAVEKPSA